MSKEDFPEELRYNKDYSWIRTEGDTAIIGVIAPSAKRVKEFVFINLPKKGKTIKQGETYISLEAVKWSGHLGSPVSGEIIDVNESLFDEPSTINEDAYGSWIMKVKLADKKETEGLLSAKQAKEHYEES